MIKGSLVLAFTAAAMFAQSTGQITGTVADKSAAVVPGTELRAKNELTGLEWTSVSDGAGRFTFARLPVGVYKVRAVREGFRGFVSESFRIDADQNLQMTVTLDVGAATESVTVSGSVSQVDTVSATIREVVDEKRITELPLNGRNPLQLVQLVPGAVTAPASSGLGRNEGIAVNGGRGTQTNYLLDGGDNNDPQDNTGAIVPNPDALEEFSVQTNNFSAQYGRSAGAVVNAITKSGTNRFHGSAYEFLRNDVLDARSFFAISKGMLRRNQYGGSMGGPLIRNKLFFFGAYEGLKQRVGSTVSNLVVPTAAEKRGDFSSSVQKPRDPLNNQPFANALVPSARIDGASLKFIDLMQIPLPNSAGGRFIYNQPQSADSRQFLGRLDYSLTERQRLSGRVFTTSAKDLNGSGLPLLTSDVAFDTWNITGSHTWTVSPSLLAVTQYTMNDSQIDRGPRPVGDGKGVSYQDMGVKVNRGGLSALGKDLVPHFRGSVTGYWNLAQDNLVLIDRPTHQFVEHVSWTRGAHMIKFGGEYRWSKSDRVTANGVDPQFTFNGQITGNAFTDFLIGRPLNFTQGSVRINQIRARSYSLYVQDDWKVSSRLSVNLGLRWEPMLPFASAVDELTAFRPGLQSKVFPSAPRGLVYAGDDVVGKDGAHLDWNNFGPRVGFAWNPFGGNRTSIRGAYGVFFDTPRFHELSHFVNSPPYSLQVTVNQPASFSDPYLNQTNPFPYTAPATAQAKAGYTFLLPATIGLSVDPFFAAPYAQQWNFNVQREVVKDYMLTVSYIGTKGTRLPIRRELNAGIFGPGATLANINARRPYAPLFQSIISYENVINSTYHAMQALLNKRFSRGFTVMASYNYAKSLDGMSLDVDGFNGQNPMNMRADKGLSDFDVRHRWITSFLWEVPGPTKGLGRWILGGWQSNGIFIAQAGRPFTVTSGQDRALTGVGTQRPDLLRDPKLDAGRSRDALMAMYFDAAAFTLPASGSYGNSGRNTMVGPGNWNLDFALFKRFRIREGWQLQYRWEMFNAFNHANLGSPRSNIGVARVGQIDTTSAPRIMQMGLRLAF
ncbi:MAG: TonB-dependent receptor [Candidatus Solibacter usitatus]|nr:TonB-dependent receptor [Candidatus Solibacter usitatus]